MTADANELQRAGTGEVAMAAFAKSWRRGVAGRLSKKSAVTVPLSKN
jgi:hypothetical protein